MRRADRAGDPDAVEVDCHGMVCITIGESAPPWRVRRELRCSSGASSPDGSIDKVATITRREP